MMPSTRSYRLLGYVTEVLTAAEALLLLFALSACRQTSLVNSNTFAAL